MATEVHLKPGWLAKDIERAAKQVDRWKKARERVMRRVAKWSEAKKSYARRIANG